MTKGAGKNEGILLNRLFSTTERHQAFRKRVSGEAGAAHTTVNRIRREI